MRIILAQINPIVGDLKGNSEKIIKGIAEAKNQHADLILFPELALTGYPPEDFLLMPSFIDSVEKHLKEIVRATSDITAIVGLPRRNNEEKGKSLFNSAAVLSNGTILGFQDKALLPNYDVFDERRYFEPATKSSSIWEIKGKKIAITICEDIWQHSTNLRESNYLHDPTGELVSQHPDLVLNLSASPFKQQKCMERLQVCKNMAQTLHCPVLLCNQVGGNDSLIFDGYSLFVGSDGNLLDHAKGFQEDCLCVDLEHKYKPISLNIFDVEDLFKALVLGVKDYFQKLGFKRACIGMSGGIDSTIVACIAVEALGKENVMGLIMPSRFSTNGSKLDALSLMDNLGMSYEEISIEKPFQGFLDLLEPHFQNRSFDTTEENMQARIRGMILMAFSNKFGYILLSTGNKSEMAMGYATLYGDMCGGLGVINDVAKMQVYELAHWINRNTEVIPHNIIEKPPSAELKENQRDSDSLPDYAIVDNVLAAYVEKHLSPEEIAEKFHYPLEMVRDLVKKIHFNEYKRRQSPPGLKVTSCAFSVGRRFPIVQRWI